MAMYRRHMTHWPLTDVALVSRGVVEACLVVVFFAHLDIGENPYGSNAHRYAFKHTYSMTW